MSALQVITIDGPAASGKSSVASMVAERLGWTFVNTGNMYRAATWVVLHAGVDPSDQEAVAHAVTEAPITFDVEKGRSVIRVGGREVEHELTSGLINQAVSKVAAVPLVRAKLTALQRSLGVSQPVVMEGRDIGTAVFPDAPWKFYIDASEEVRAQRRGVQGQADSVSERDRLDSTRKIAPLKVADDAVLIDSSYLNLDQVVAEVWKVLQAKGLPVS